MMCGSRSKPELTRGRSANLCSPTSALGAYPAPSHGAVCIAPIAKGEFNHSSRLYLDEDKANFQLHTWEYLIAEELMVM